MATSDPPARPRRERPLVAPGRERRPPLDLPPPTVWAPPIVDYPPSDPSKRGDHVWVTFTGPMPQRRATVAFRFVLAVPHVLWVGLLNYAHMAVAVVAWFAALFTGEVPAGMSRFLAQLVQYQARVTAYGLLLLTDEYPPFALDAADYAVNVHVAPGRFNRIAVLFRIVLMVPSLLLSSVLFIGAQILSVVSWLLTLVAGRLPTPLWEANAAVLRYQVRTYAFASLLTAEQPGGVLGDRDDAAPPVDPAPRLPIRPRIVRLALSRAGRRLVVLFGVVCVVTYSSIVALGVITAVRLDNARDELRDARAHLEVSLDAFVDEANLCPDVFRPDCLREASARLADGFDRFADDLVDIEFNEVVSAPTLIEDARACASALRRMSLAPDRSAFEAANADYAHAFDVFVTDYREVTFDVGY